MIDAETLAEWKTIAEAATPGPWEVDSSIGTDEAFVCDGNGMARAYVRDGQIEDIRHIATFDPPTVLALIAEVEQLQHVEWEQRQDWLVASTKKITAQRDALQAQVDAVKALHWAKPPWRGALAECQECDRRSPCETTRILAALGETGDDRG